jgi:hypothetical protein
MAFKMKYNSGGFPFKKTDEDPDTYKLGLDELGESPAPKDHSKYFSGKFPVHKDYNHPRPGFSLYKGKANFKHFINMFKK